MGTSFIGYRMLYLISNWWRALILTDSSVIQLLSGDSSWKLLWLLLNFCEELENERLTAVSFAFDRQTWPHYSLVLGGRGFPECGVKITRTPLSCRDRGIVQLCPEVLFTEVFSLYKVQCEFAVKELYWWDISPARRDPGPKIFLLYCDTTI
jgi:hypothetical protein